MRKETRSKANKVVVQLIDEVFEFPFMWKAIIFSAIIIRIIF